QEKWNEAEQEERQILSIRLRALPRDDSRVLSVRRMLAVALAYLKKFDESEQQITEILSAQESLLRAKAGDPTCSKNLTSTVELMASVKLERKNWPDAAIWLARAINGLKDLASEEDSRKKLLSAYVNLAWCQLHTRDFTGAL